MGFLSHRVDRAEIEPGDHIYTWRSGYTYAHHGIYIGESENWVVHFTSRIALSSLNFSAPCSKNLLYCGFCESGSEVMLSCLDCFLAGGSLHRFEYGVSLPVFKVKRRGTCTTAKSDAPEVVICRTIGLLDKGFEDYSLLKNNCEDFAKYCKRGLPILDLRGPGSSQVAGAKDAIRIAAVAAGAGAAAAAAAAAAAGAGAAGAAAAAAAAGIGFLAVKWATH